MGWNAELFMRPQKCYVGAYTKITFEWVYKPFDTKAHALCCFDMVNQNMTIERRFSHINFVSYSHCLRFSDARIDCWQRHKLTQQLWHEHEENGI